MSATVKVERLVNLTVALLEARRPMTFAEIRRRTGYYAQSDAESARRMFERDKDDLRRLGVPIVTSEVAFGEDVGYLVDRRRYELPDIDLSAPEVAALAAAVGMAGSEAIRLTWARLAARAPDPGDVPTPSVKVVVAADAVEQLAVPIIDRRTVEFDYRGASGGSRRRRIDPYAVAQRRGAWYLVGRDHERAALRTFRIDRIEGAIEVVTDVHAFPEPPSFDLAEALSAPDANVVALRLEVAAEARWAVQAKGGVNDASTDAFADELGEDHRSMIVPAFDTERDLGWLLGLTPHVQVVAPADVRTRVREALERVRDTHGVDAPARQEQT